MNRDVKVEVRQLLAKMSNLIENEDENEKLKLEMHEMKEKMKQMSDQLKLKDLIIYNKDEVISRLKEASQQKLFEFDEKLKEKEELIVQQESVIKRQGDCITDYSAYVIELSDIIDQKEMVIINKEDFIEEQIVIIKKQQLEFRERYDNVVESLNQRTFELEEAKRHQIQRSETNSRKLSSGLGRTLYNNLKIHHLNALTRCNKYAERITQLEDTVSLLREMMERNQMIGYCGYTDDVSF
jgi:chromosome segregation ATPase